MGGYIFNREKRNNTFEYLNIQCYKMDIYA